MKRTKIDLMLEAQDDHPAWRVVMSILVFIAALAIAALLSIDDIEGRRGTTEVEHGTP